MPVNIFYASLNNLNITNWLVLIKDDPLYFEKYIVLWVVENCTKI